MRLPDWMKRRRRDLPKQTDFQKIFSQARINGGLYIEPPAQRITLPKDTWLQKKRGK